MSVTKLFLQDTDWMAARYVQDGSIEWEAESVGEGGVLEAGVARFRTRLGAVLPFRPRKYMYVEMRDADDVVRFAGRVRRVTRVRTLGVETGQYEIECSDWATELAGINLDVDFTWTAGENDKHLVQRLVDLKWAQLGTGLTHYIYASHHNMPAGEITQGAGSVADALEHIGGLARVSSCWIDPLKGLHWNHIQQLAAVVLDDENKTGDYRSYHSLREVDDGTDVAFRVTVIGAGGITATVTDWPAYYEYARQRQYERGAPAVRIPQLPDHTDLSLATVADCEAVAWVLLRQQAPRRTIEVGLRDIHVYPGQIVDLIDEDGRDEPDFAWLDDEDLWAPGEPTRLHLKVGRFQVRSVVPQPLGGGEYDYIAELGAYRPALEQIVRAA